MTVIRPSHGRRHVTCEEDVNTPVSWCCVDCGINANAERFGSLEVDVELYLSRLLNRQIGGLVAFENSSGLDSRHAIGFPFSFATQADSDGHGAPPKSDIDSQSATRRERRRRTSPWPIRRV